MIRELARVEEVRSACGDDDLAVWAAQRLDGGARAWALGDAVVAACPGLAHRDRLVVTGGTACAVELVRFALAELGGSYRPMGSASLLEELALKVEGLEIGGRFSWMSLPAPPLGDDDGWPGVGWLPVSEEGEVAALLAVHAPSSYAQPGMAAVRRWAGVRVEGELASVAADAWSTPSVGLLAGVATVARHRGAGLAARVCGWLAGELVAEHGRAALMVDDENAAALAVYARLGFSRRRLAVGWLPALA
ncbi:GNAT family N-acetyltransferase [Nonomuraea sp. NPDC050310]|uniref:GNAT family N-acetyltransferase n=1 Tax=unclassified Nonomuraea TaxID=2593643 RepID=UPI0033D3F65F